MWRLVLVLPAVLLGACWPPECESVTYESARVLTVREDDPIHAAAIDACFDSDAACEGLCRDLLGPPPDGTTRDDIVECYLNRDGSGGLIVNAVQRLTTKCEPDLEPDADWGWYPYDAERAPDAWPQPDAPQPDAMPADAASEDAGS